MKKLLTRKNLSSIPAISLGVDSEVIARQEQMKKMIASNQEYQCFQLAGHIVFPLYPHLGASPNGLS